MDSNTMPPVPGHQQVQPATPLPAYPAAQQAAQPQAVYPTLPAQAQPQPEVVYPYGYEFQKFLLAVAVQDPTFLMTSKDCLQPGYFEDRTLRFTAQAIISFYEQYGQVPQYVPLTEYTNFLLRNKGRADVAQSVQELIYQLYLYPAPNADYIQHEALRFAQQQLVKKAVLQGIDVLKKNGDPRTVLEAMEHAMSIGQVQEVGTDLVMGEQIGEMWRAMQESRGAIATRFLPTFDETLFRTGPRRGELYVIQAVPKAGKSMFMVNFGVNALWQGQRVLHITIGDLKEFDVLLRYCSRITGWRMDDIIWHNPGFVHDWRQLMIQEGRLKIRYYPPYTLTATGLRSYMSWLKATQNFVPDMLIIDYPDKFYFDRSQTYSEMGRIYMEIKRILDDFNCVGWIASQSNRGAAKEQLNTTANMAESWDKLANADGVCPITMGEKDKPASPGQIIHTGHITFYAENLRFGADHLKISVWFDFSTCQLMEDSERTRSTQSYNANMAQATHQAQVMSQPGPQVPATNVVVPGTAMMDKWGQVVS